ncbi:MAG TPA: hypothetical protein VM689_13060 [Aliidongia sp.]|nr:hypothetical protein [Aliidongia sp.]
MHWHGPLSFLLLAAIASPAAATQKLMDSQSNYWEAGKRSPELSHACSVSRFNEDQIGRYVVRLHAKNGGAAVLGVAKGNGFNLSDPDHLAKPGEDYMFRNDGTSDCEVFVGVKPPPKPDQTTPGQTPPGQAPPGQAPPAGAPPAGKP